MAYGITAPNGEIYILFTFRNSFHDIMQFGIIFIRRLLP